MFGISTVQSGRCKEVHCMFFGKKVPKEWHFRFQLGLVFQRLFSSVCFCTTYGMKDGCLERQISLIETKLRLTSFLNPEI